MNPPNYFTHVILVSTTVISRVANEAGNLSPFLVDNTTRDFTIARGMEAAVISQHQIRCNLSVCAVGSALVHIEVERLQSTIQ